MHARTCEHGKIGKEDRVMDGAKAKQGAFLEKFTFIHIGPSKFFVFHIVTPKKYFLARSENILSTKIIPSTSQLSRYMRTNGSH